jgi:hypothetical protein
MANAASPQLLEAWRNKNTTSNNSASSVKFEEPGLRLRDAEAGILQPLAHGRRDDQRPCALCGYCEYQETVSSGVRSVPSSFPP